MNSPSPILTASYTAFFGVLVFITGQFIQRFFLEPIQDLRRSIGDVYESLIFYANKQEVEGESLYLKALVELDGNSDPRSEYLKDRYKGLLQKCYAESDEAKSALRAHASKLPGKANAIYCYKIWAVLGFIPHREDLIKSCSELIKISNADRFDAEKVKRIAELLKMRS